MPISYEEFEAAVRRGLGRAVLWLKRGEVAPNRDFLLYACTHNLAYDRQTEDNRALYMYDIIQATGEPEFYSQFVMQSLSEVSDNQADWDDDERSIYQMFDLVGLLAKSGDMTAKQALYAFFMKHTAGPDDFHSEVIVDVDGLEGYLFVIRQWLQHPREDDDHWHEAWLLEDTEKRFGADKVQQFLENAALTEPAIGIYVAKVRKKQTAWYERRKQRLERHWPDYAELQQLLSDIKIRYGPMVWARYGEHLSDADAEQIARELLAETNPARLERCLRLFKVRPFPLDHTPLLALARSSDKAIASAARAALAQISDPTIHALASELVKTDLQPWEWVDMLTLNFQAGDEKAIEHILEKQWDADELHWIGLRMRDVFERNTTPLATDALLSFYERGYCTFCRYGVIKLLAEVGPLPPHIVEEGQFDADEAARELVQAGE